MGTGPSSRGLPFSGRLYHFRVRLGWSQRDAALYLETSKGTYQRWEAGAITPLAITQEGALARLAKAYAQRKRGKTRIQHTQKTKRDENQTE